MQYVTMKPETSRQKFIGKVYSFVIKAVLWRIHTIHTEIYKQQYCSFRRNIENTLLASGHISKTLRKMSNKMFRILYVGNMR